MQPPALDLELGLASYLTDTPGIGGHLRGEPEDFRVIELGDGPKPGDGAFTAARIELRNWETNRFAGIAARKMGIRPGLVAFAGMKDKRAVTEQWFTFKCPEDRLANLAELNDVQVLEQRRTNRKTFAGAHAGNRFVLRVRGHHGDAETVDACLDQIRQHGGVPHFFGHQRFGSGVRPITAQMGKLIVAGDLEGAVRLYCGQPMEGEREETYAARKAFDEQGPEAALEILPRPLDLERAMMERLVKQPDDWRYALMALPHNLRTLFVHAHQSWVFNHILSARLDAGLGLKAAHVGDRVMGIEDDGTQTVPVTARNLERVQAELDAGRAVLTAPLPGMDTPMATGLPGEIEAAVLERLGIQAADFRCSQLPSAASPGRRRGILQHVDALESTWVDGDPVVSFALGRGSYATVVMRELLKAGPEAY